MTLIQHPPYVFCPPFGDSWDIKSLQARYIRGPDPTQGIRSCVSQVMGSWAQMSSSRGKSASDLAFPLASVFRDLCSQVILQQQVLRWVGGQCSIQRLIHSRKPLLRYVPPGGDSRPSHLLSFNFCPSGHLSAHPASVAQNSVPV